jgi:PPOX class probable F420-dependent enzyme
MPKAPLPPELERFAKEPHPAIVGTVRADGAPITAATWYDWDDGRIMLSMNLKERRIHHIRHEPRISLTILDDNWYRHLSLLGQVVELREDADLVDLDRLSQRYVGTPRTRRDVTPITAIMEITHWHSYGDIAASADS